MSDETMRVSLPGGVRVEAQYKGFVIKTDQPAYAGGENSAPSPFDLFLASLGTCAGYFVAAFCQERGIPTEGVFLGVRIERNPKTRMVGKIGIEISLPPDFPGKYKAAVVKAADQCTVKNHLAQPPAFEITASLRT
jgi:ribosomal protein S12 methylthiotransferase accessory factor